MIQTGDSTGQASDDERKILANTLFYLYQISQQTTAKDASFYDIDAPDVPEVISENTSAGKVNVTVSSQDNGTSYDYYIKAVPSDENSESVLSNTRSHDNFSGLAGFVVGVNGSSEPSPELIVYDETNEFVQSIVKADANGNAVVTAVPEDLTAPQFIHIFAVDNANNVSEDVILPFSDTDLTTKVDTDKKLYNSGDTVSVDTNTLSKPFGRTADMTIEILDEFDNKTAELTSAPEQKLDPGVNFNSAAEWQVPETLTGRYKAVITWKNGDITIASDESFFKVANEESVVNTVSSDKKRYSTKDPINLASIAYNKSTSMIENDLMLYVDVFNTSSEKVASFEHVLSTMNPNSESDFSDALLPKVLPAGNYTVTARVMQGDSEISSDSAEFEVYEEAPMFVGGLTLTPSDNAATADFNVTNNGKDAAENAVVSVIVYKDGSEDYAYTFSKTVTFGAGENISFSDIFTLPEPSEGTYSGVLTVQFNGDAAELAYDSFEISPETPVVTEPVTVPEKTVKSDKTTKTTQKTTTTKATTTSPKSDSPKTGVGAIPPYMWAIAVLSLTGIVTLRKKGADSDE